jgi:hypothetical protein
MKTINPIRLPRAAVAGFAVAVAMAAATVASSAPAAASGSVSGMVRAFGPAATSGQRPVEVTVASTTQRVSVKGHLSTDDVALTVDPGQQVKVTVMGLSDSNGMTIVDGTLAYDTGAGPLEADVSFTLPSPAKGILITVDGDADPFHLMTIVQF